MSELKYYKLRHIVSALASPDFTTGVVFDNHDEVYYKSEADKVIAGKDKAIAELRNEADIYKAKYEQEYDIAVHNEKQLSVMRIELRHHKYKRCLAMAEACDKYAFALELQGQGRSTELLKRHNRAIERKYKWLAIAEKFKTNSTLQQKD